MNEGSVDEDVGLLATVVSDENDEASSGGFSAISRVLQAARGVGIDIARYCEEELAA